MVLHLRQEAPDWTSAKCLGQATGPDNDPWFDNEADGFSNDTEEAREFCNGTVDGRVCPIRERCLLFALVNNERFGVWGGTSEVDRRAIRKMWPWPGGSDPHPEWTWHPPGEVLTLLPDKDKVIGDDDED
jgi:hypothetical protein